MFIIIIYCIINTDIFTKKTMNNFFNIDSVAIVWASEVEWKIWNTLIKNLSFFKGEKYWVNPKWWKYKGIDFYESISLLPKKVDILVFAIPSKFVETSLIEAWKKWIKRVIIISAWFKEVWNIKEEEKLKIIANEYNISLLWPNCLGYYDTYKNLNLTFWTSNIGKWNVAMISQSWAMAVALSDWANINNIWFSKIISMWNKAWIDELDLLYELENDENTSVIAVYLESLDRWLEFYNLAKKITLSKPIVLIKSWVSELWSKAASSHTWALASQKEVLESAFEASNIHFTNSLEDFFLWVKIFSQNISKKIPEELAIITNAWWPWVMSTDHSQFYNLGLSAFTNDERDILKEWLPNASSVENPIDIIWDATSKTYSQILNNLRQIVKKRAILILLTAQTTTDVENVSKVIIDFKKENPDEFIMTSFMWWIGVQKWREILNDNDILTYDYPRKALLAYSKLIKQEKNKIKKIEAKVINKKVGNILEIKELLKKENWLVSLKTMEKIFKSFWINYLKEYLVKKEDEIENIYELLNHNNLVAKISSEKIPHKTDIWGVEFNIKTIYDAKKSYNNILNNVKKHFIESDIEWISFSKNLYKDNNTREIFVWFKRDNSFKTVLILWLWWIYVNLFEDVSRRVWMVTKQEIEIMLRELKSFELLNWYRWSKKINLNELIDLIYNLQFVFSSLEEINQIDINPIFADSEWSIIVDAKLYLNS